ncbi:MAG TPA: ion channel, partial [Pseudobdellovibrionaceae bacterium]|nr:ion channel [Pseudobdellovibrionaceae bacterium]
MKSLSKWSEFILKNPFKYALYFILLCWVGLGSLVYHFEQSSSEQNIKTFGDGIWWGIVTLLTVGYGD